MTVINAARPPAITLFHTWQLVWQGVLLDDTAEFLQRDKEHLIGLMFGRVGLDDPEVQGVRRWARETMQAR